MTAKKKRWLIWGGLGLMLFLALTLAFAPRAVPVDLATVERGPMRLTVDEEGFTRIHDVFTLSAPVAGRLRRVEVHAGDALIAEETLVAELQPVDPTLLDPRSEVQARAGVRAAESARKLAAAELQRATAEMEFARTEHRRSAELVKEGAIAQRDFDAAERAYKTATASVATARQALEVRQFELDRARALLLTPAQSRERSGDCECIPVTAPVDGRVLKVFDPSERTVAAGEPLVQVGDPADLEVVVDLLSSDAVQVEPGQRVLIERWGGAAPLEGRVQRVEPFGFTKVSALGIEEQRVNVVIDLTSPPEDWRRLGHGYQVETRIILWESDDALRVPLTALFRDGEGWAVFAEEGGRARLRPVQVGRRNRLVAEILDGLAPGERIVVHPSDRILAGTRIAGR
ncbi:MAG: HlyD family efflux transporter periplasmic adaptor subunit [Acidobacteria bacterium]|nr:HlyD family efflux transporter periplasmic adaptor subunit [Acidobacteriota bacterium]